MSPSWPEPVRIALAPHQVALVRLARGWSARVRDRKWLACEPAATSNWSGAIETLRELLAHPNIGRGRATVILSNHFARYLLLPWSEALVTEGEEREFARTRFHQVFGEAALGWRLRLSAAQPGAPRLAAAVDQALLDAVTTALSASALKLVSVQPALMALFNAHRRSIGDNAWLVSAERGRLLIAWISSGQWRAVRSRPLNGEPVVLAPLLEQERLLLGTDKAMGKVCLSMVDEVGVDGEGLRIERLWPPARTEARFALAMLGAD